MSVLSPPGLASRGLLVCVLGGVGVGIGWTLTRGQPTVTNWLLPTIALVSSLLFGVGVYRTPGRRSLWIVSLCAVIAGRAAYELARLFLHR